MPVRPLDTEFRENSNNLAGQLEEAFNNIGSSMMTYDFAGKLLAFLLKYGGGMEAVTHHAGLNAGIMIAQEKCNLKGGCIPTMEGVQAFQKYYKELNAEKQDLECDWLWEVFMRYELNTSALKSKCPQYVIAKYGEPKKSSGSKQVKKGGGLSQFIDSVNSATGK